jgi:hypothetical protein
MPAMNYFLSVYRLIDILVIYVATYKSEITFKDFQSKRGGGLGRLF